MKKSESFYQTLAETLPVQVFCRDKDGRFIFGNDLFCQAIGKTLAGILGKTDADFFPPELAAKYRRSDQEVMSSGKVWEDFEPYQTPRAKKGMSTCSKHRSAITTV